MVLIYLSLVWKRGLHASEVLVQAGVSLFLSNCERDGGKRTYPRMKGVCLSVVLMLMNSEQVAAVGQVGWVCGRLERGSFRWVEGSSSTSDLL